MNERSMAGGLTLGMIVGMPVAAAPMKSTEPTLAAHLVDAEKKAMQKSATVVVSLSGIKVIDPGSVREQSAKGQGHLHYRLDNGPVIATTATKLSFHELTSGAHTITVVLAGNDHAALGPAATLKVTVP
jgi:hypothetical protein